MLITWGTDTYWVDIFVANTHPSGSVIRRINGAIRDKQATYAPAKEMGVNVFPVGFSHLGVPIASREFLKVVATHSKQAVPELHNLIAVTTAVALGLYIKKSLITRLHEQNHPSKIFVENKHNAAKHNSHGGSKLVVSPISTPGIHASS